MFDLLTRALRHPIDYSGYFRKCTLYFSDHYVESSGLHTFIFTAPKLPHWKAGQHGIFTLTDETTGIPYTRIFSIASAHHEGVVRIGTEISDNPSDFKKQLRTFRAGYTIEMRGPFGEFHTRMSQKHIVGIAGGVGITPFRALCIEMAKNQDKTPLTLIYGAPPTKHTYQAELERMKLSNSNFTLICINSPEEVNANLVKQIQMHKNNAFYYIAGSPNMIKAITKTCHDNGIHSRNIVNDPFKGY
jgi:ferredoxin-NADP reductase